MYVIYIYILPCSSHSEKKIPRSTCVCVCVRDSIVGEREREVVEEEDCKPCPPVDIYINKDEVDGRD